MTVFIKKIISLILTSILVICILHIIVNYRLTNGNVYEWQSDWHSLVNHNADVLFVGNSRSWTSINPFIIDEKLSVNSEIIAVDGQSINFVFLKLKQYLLVNPPPKRIFLQFDSFFLKERNDLYSIEKISPYFFQNKFNVSSLQNKNGYNPVYEYIPIIPINLNYLARILLNIKLKSPYNYENTKGHFPQKIQWELKDEKVNIDNNLKFHVYEFNPSNYLDSIVRTCENFNIELIAFNPPLTSSMQHVLENKNAKYFNLSKTYNIPYLDFNKFEEFDNYNLFYNHTHLNEEGSIIFTNLFANEIYNLNN